MGLNCWDTEKLKNKDCHLSMIESKWTNKLNLAIIMSLWKKELKSRRPEDLNPLLQNVSNKAKTET